MKFVQLDNEEELNVREAKPGVFSWIFIGTAVYSFLSAVLFWSEIVEKSKPDFEFTDDIDPSPPERVMRIINTLSGLNEVGLSCFVISFLFSAFALGRMHFLSTKYANSKRLSVIFSVLAYAALVPVVMHVQELTTAWTHHLISNLKSLGGLVSAPAAWVGNLVVNQGGLLACDIFVLLLAAFAVKWLLFSAPFIKRYSGGVVVGINPWRTIWGAKVIHWSEIRKAAISRGKDKKDSLVIQTAKFTYRFPWDVVEKAFDPTEFMNDLRSNCPAEILDNSLALRAELKHDAGTYTELWLKYFSASTARTRTGQLSSGDKLHENKYEIAGELGAGGQGTAYLAAMTDADGKHRTVVLKEYILPVHRGDSIFQQSVRKLQQEAEILEKIRHQNIVQLVDTFVEDHRGYLVMEFVEGKTLKQIVQSEGKQSEAVVIDVALQVCEILEHLHSMNPSIIHRDLTPDNLILQPDGKLKLVDFNVAHKLDSSATATVVGKHAYLPPEQFRGKPTEQSDLYALGGTLYFLLTGQDPPPLASSNPRQLVDTVSEKMNSIVAAATALDLAKRTASAKQMRAELLKLNGASEAMDKQKFDLSKGDPSKGGADRFARHGYEFKETSAGEDDSDRDHDSSAQAIGANAELESPGIDESTDSESGLSIVLKEGEAIER